ncbi:MAG: 50S ribosomal protein L32 [Elusimicrobiota bacterium]
MPNPYRRHTRHRTRSRRAQNWRLEAGAMSVCSQCKEIKPPHQVCPHCGFYDGNLVVPKKEKKSKKKGPEAEGTPEEKPAE